MADVNFTPVKFALNTGASGTYDITQSGMSASGDIKAAIFFMVGATADDTKTPDNIQSIGFCDGTDEIVFGGASEDALSTTNSAKMQRADSVIVGADFNNSATPILRHSFDSFITDGVRLTINVQAPSAFLCTVVFIHGTDVSNAKTLIHDDLGTVETAQDITSVGFEADLVFTLADNLGGTVPTRGTSHDGCFGAVLNTGTDVNAVTAWSQRDGRGSSNAVGIVRNTDSLSALWNTRENWAAMIDNFDSTGFDITVTGYTSSDAESDNFGFLALKFSNSPDVALFDMTWPTSGSYAETNPGFTPDFGMICSNAGVDARNTRDSTGPFGVGVTVFDDTNLYAMSWSGADAHTTSDENSRHADSLSLVDPNGDTNVVASSYAFDADGWDFTLSTNPGSTVFGWGLAIGGGVAGGAIDGTIATAFSHTATLTGTGELASTAPVAFSETAALIGIGPISATEAITFAETADLKGGGALAGSIPLAFADSAALTGLGELAATAAISFAESAVLIGLAPIDGTITMVFGESAGLSSIGPISATMPITFDDSATLTGFGELAGTAPIAFSETVDLIGRGALAGSIPLSIGVSATLIGFGELAGTTPMAFDSVADLTAPGAGQIDGTIAITYSDAVTLTGLGELDGSIAVAFDKIAALIGRAALDGTIPISFSDSVALIGSGELNAAEGISFGHSADLKGAGALLGTIPLVFGQSSALIGTGELTGTIPVAFDSTAALSGIGSGAISGTIALSFDDTATMTGLGALTGAISLLVGDSVTLIGKADISGTIAAAFGHTASLDGIGELAGVTAIVIDSAADLQSVGGVMSGTASIVFGTTVDLKGGGALAGTVPLVFGELATLIQGGIDVPNHRVIPVFAKDKTFTAVGCNKTITVNLKGKTIN